MSMGIPENKIETVANGDTKQLDTAKVKVLHSESEQTCQTWNVSRLVGRTTGGPILCCSPRTRCQRNIFQVTLQTPSFWPTAIGQGTNRS